VTKSEYRSLLGFCDLKPAYIRNRWEITIAQYNHYRFGISKIPKAIQEDLKELVKAKANALKYRAPVKK